MRKRVYIAGPMSLGDRVENLAAAMKSMRELMQLGYAPFMPQLTFFLEPFVQAQHEEWLAVDLPWVVVANALLRLVGESTGADMEVEQAHLFGVPVFCSVAELHTALS